LPVAIGTAVVAFTAVTYGMLLFINYFTKLSVTVYV
jgi:hypothetical protein